MPEWLTCFVKGGVPVLYSFLAQTYGLPDLEGELLLPEDLDGAALPDEPEDLAGAVLPPEDREGAGLDEGLLDGLLIFGVLEGLREGVLAGRTDGWLGCCLVGGV